MSECSLEKVKIRKDREMKRIVKRSESPLLPTTRRDWVDHHVVAINAHRRADIAIGASQLRIANAVLRLRPSTARTKVLQVKGDHVLVSLHAIRPAGVAVVHEALRVVPAEQLLGTYRAADGGRIALRADERHHLQGRRRRRRRFGIRGPSGCRVGRH